MVQVRHRAQIGRCGRRCLRPVGCQWVGAMSSSGFGLRSRAEWQVRTPAFKLACLRLLARAGSGSVAACGRSGWPAAAPSRVEERRIKRRPPLQW
jgi:hypothetical protein